MDSLLSSQLSFITSLITSLIPSGYLIWDFLAKLIIICYNRVKSYLDFICRLNRRGLGASTRILLIGSLCSYLTVQTLSNVSIILKNLLNLYFVLFYFFLFCTDYCLLALFQGMLYTMQSFHMHLPILYLALKMKIFIHFTVRVGEKGIQGQLRTVWLLGITKIPHGCWLSFGN